MNVVNYLEGYTSEMCYKCSNAYISETYDGITVTQRAMPKESKMIWVIIGIVTLSFLIICLSAVWFVHHHDTKKEDKWRSKYMAERME
jgi:hypothetical protein